MRLRAVKILKRTSDGWRSLDGVVNADAVTHMIHFKTLAIGEHVNVGLVGGGEVDCLGSLEEVLAALGGHEADAVPNAGKWLE